MPWLLNEDAALKYQLQGMLVSDQNAPAGGRKVTVRYRSPEDEVAKYTPPLILIEMPALSMAYDRMHAGMCQLPYAPEGYAPWWPDNATSYDPADSPYWGPVPVAYDITYQLTVYTRINRDHMMPILAMLEAETRLGRYSVLNIPQDGTFRRITRKGGPEREYRKDEAGKRLFTATYVIRVPTELVTVNPPGPRATDIFGTINTVKTGGGFSADPYCDPADLTGTQVAAAFGIHGSRAPAEFNTYIPPGNTSVSPDEGEYPIWNPN
jgi:hypothetical protein